MNTKEYTASLLDLACKKVLAVINAVKSPGGYPSPDLPDGVDVEALKRVRGWEIRVHGDLSFHISSAETGDSVFVSNLTAESFPESLDVRSGPSWLLVYGDPEDGPVAPTRKSYPNTGGDVDPAHIDDLTLYVLSRVAGAGTTFQRKKEAVLQRLETVPSVYHSAVTINSIETRGTGTYFSDSESLTRRKEDRKFPGFGMTIGEGGRTWADVHVGRGKDLNTYFFESRYCNGTGLQDLLDAVYAGVDLKKKPSEDAPRELVVSDGLVVLSGSPKKDPAVERMFDSFLSRARELFHNHPDWVASYEFPTECVPRASVRLRRLDGTCINACVNVHASMRRPEITGFSACTYWREGGTKYSQRASAHDDSQSACESAIRMLTEDMDRAVHQNSDKWQVVISRLRPYIHPNWIHGIVVHDDGTSEVILRDGDADDFFLPQTQTDLTLDLRGEIPVVKGVRISCVDRAIPLTPLLSVLEPAMTYWMKNHMQPA